MPSEQYLRDGALTLAAASWDDASGAPTSVGFENAGLLTVPRGGQVIVSGCDQSGATTGVEKFDVLPAFNGQLGDATHPLKFDCDGTAESLTNITSRFRYWASGGMCFYNSANGCHILEVGLTGAGAPMFLGVGGTFKHVRLEAGSASFTDQVSCTASGIWDICNGKLKLDEHASNTFNVINIDGGSDTHEIHRGGTTLSLNGGSTVLDVKNGSVSNINVRNGRLILRSHNATGPTLTALSGVIDFSELRAPITLSGAKLGPVRFIGYKRSMVTLTSMQPVGGGPIGLN